MQLFQCIAFQCGVDGFKKHMSLILTTIFQVCSKSAMLTLNTQMCVAQVGLFSTIHFVALQFSMNYTFVDEDLDLHLDGVITLCYIRMHCMLHCITCNVTTLHFGRGGLHNITL